VTSANTHGEEPCANASEVRVAFAQREGLAGVLDAGERHGAVSTVLDLCGPAWHVRREGAISRATLATYLD
jgi:tRNA A37 threonylcarbamoyladenosine synthetase subunit TsaC/SUA5/YrdC